MIIPEVTRDSSKEFRNQFVKLKYTPCESEENNQRISEKEKIFEFLFKYFQNIPPLPITLDS
jgi:hypothetical protein